FDALNSAPLLPPGLYNGSAGCLLCTLQSDHIFNDEHFRGNLSFSLESLIIHSSNLSNYSFSSGKAGINWFYAFLYKNNTLTKEDWDAIKYNDEDLINEVISSLSKGNHEFLYGAAGI